MRWDRKIQPLVFAEGNQQAVESLEQVSLTATTLYFDLLVAQVNLQIAETNRVNNDTLADGCWKPTEIWKKPAKTTA